MAEKLLTEKELRAAKPDLRLDTYLFDGGGIVARVLSGYKPHEKRIAFTYRYKFEGRSRYYPCGTYIQGAKHCTKLAEARRARKVREKGIDPWGKVSLLAEALEAFQVQPVN